MRKSGITRSAGAGMMAGIEASEGSDVAGATAA
jgi:hypothetical protein